MTRTPRKFECTDGKRENTPCLVGVVGASGSGKTYSALRVAAGMQRVTGGDIGFIDTETRRGLHYADRFKFKHLELNAPFDSASYLEAVEYFVNKGVSTIVIDSMSHEHQGEGGLLDQVGLDGEKRVKFSEWLGPKLRRGKMINGFLQAPANIIFCFRAKEKLKPVKTATGAQELEYQGWTAVTGKEFLYEMLMNFLLVPGSLGRPLWNSDFDGERALMKIPGQFQHLFPTDVPFDKARQLTEEVGQVLAEWTAGKGAEPPKPVDTWVFEYDQCDSVEAFSALDAERAVAWVRYNKIDKQQIKDAVDRAAARLVKPSAA